MTVVSPLPMVRPMGPRTSRVRGNTMMKHTMGTKNTRMGLGVILVTYFSTKYSAVTARMAGNT